MDPLKDCGHKRLWTVAPYGLKVGVESHGEVSPLPLCTVGEFFLNKVWNALLCFIICSLILLLCTFTNRAPRKRGKKEGKKWENRTGALEICQGSPARRGRRMDRGNGESIDGAVINNHLPGKQPVYKTVKEKEEKTKSWVTRRIISTLPLVFTFQACKSCTIQPNVQMISSSSWETGIIGFLQVSSSFLSLHVSFSLALSLCPSFFLCMCKTETIWRRSVAQPRGDRGLGGRASGDDGAEGGLECKV